MDTELHYRECRDLLGATTVGRCAISTPQGPVIVPVNHTVVDDALILRTSPYSQLGTYGWSARVAYEVDSYDEATRSGWSVVALGTCERIDNVAEATFLRTFHDPDPWARGARTLFLRLRWDQLTGRRIGMTRMDTRSAG